MLRLLFYAIGKRALRHKRRSARTAMGRKGIMPQKRPAAGGEASKRASFLWNTPGAGS